jgi:hypothetical protein
LLDHMRSMSTPKEAPRRVHKLEYKKQQEQMYKQSAGVLSDSVTWDNGNDASDSVKSVPFVDAYSYAAVLRACDKAGQTQVGSDLKDIDMSARILLRKPLVFLIRCGLFLCPDRDK